MRPITPRKLFIFALPRSGSTLLCDLLTVPGEQLILHEPMILRRFGDSRQDRVLRTLQKFGLQVDSSPHFFTPGTAALPWFEQQVIPQFSKLRGWGLKEVFLADAERLIERYQPDRLVLLWRDPQDVALSLLELMNRSLMAFSDRKTLKDEAWALECVREAAHNLSRIAVSYPHHLIRYEDLMTSADAQQALLDYLDLPRFSDTRLALDHARHSDRQTETVSHQQRFSTSSLHRWNREQPGWRKTFARVCRSAVQAPAVRAGYPESELVVADVCAGSSTPLSQRINEADYLPTREFDFAYAKRRARMKVASLLPPGSSVLDVGSTTAALAFLVKHIKVTAIDDGETGKRLLSKPWRDGVFPTLNLFNIATCLFSLEYIDDPQRLLDGLLKRNMTVIVTYHCTDDLPEPVRRELGFSSHLSRSDWQAWAAANAARTRFEWSFDGFQTLICLGAAAPQCRLQPVDSLVQTKPPASVVNQNHAYTDADLTFLVHTYRDAGRLKTMLTSCRQLYPQARLIVCADGDRDPALPRLAADFDAGFHLGENLYALGNGGKVCHRMLMLFLRKPTRYLFKVNPDTGFHRRFAYLPNPSGMFGTVQSNRYLSSIQGGCCGITRDWAEKFYRERVFLDASLLDAPHTWAMDRKLWRVMQRSGRVSSDWIFGYVATIHGCPQFDFAEVKSSWRTIVDNQDLRYANTHPFAISNE